MRFLFFIVLIAAIFLGFFIVNPASQDLGRGFTFRRLLERFGIYQVEKERKAVVDEKRLSRKEYQEQLRSLEDQQRLMMETRELAENQFRQGEKLSDKAVRLLMERLLESMVLDTKKALEQQHQIEQHKDLLLQNRELAEQRLRESRELINAQLRIVVGDLMGTLEANQEFYRGWYGQIQAQQEGLLSHRETMEENYLRCNEDLDSKVRNVVEGLILGRHMDQGRVREKFRDFERQREDLVAIRKEAEDRLKASHQQVQQQVELLIKELVEKSEEGLKKTREATQDKIDQLKTQRQGALDPARLRQRSRDLAEAIERRRTEAMENRRQMEQQQRHFRELMDTRR